MIYINNILFPDCIDGFYKEDCSSECGKCADGKACNKINGTCENGCSSTFLPPLCQGTSKEPPQNTTIIT